MVYTASAVRIGTRGACAHVRNAVIGFPAHGPGRQVEAATAARDVPVGESWAHDPPLNGRGRTAILRLSSLTKIRGFCVRDLAGARTKMILVPQTLGKLARGSLRLGYCLALFGCHYRLIRRRGIRIRFRTGIVKPTRLTLIGHASKPAVFRCQNPQQNERLRWLRDFGQSSKSRRPPTMLIEAFYG